MKVWARRAALFSTIALAIIAGAFGAVIAFDTAAGPVADRDSPAASITSSALPRDLPPRLVVKARDGAPIAYRYYEAPGGAVWGGRVVVLVHGSTGTSIDMNEAARALQAAGATVYSLDLRGHGGSGFGNGQVTYIGQLDDDLKDFVKAVGLGRSGVRPTMVGYSMGGGFVMRTASGRNAGMFDSYLAISPHVPDDTAFSLNGDGHWVKLAKPRILALHALDSMGFPLFQDLVVARYQRACNPDDTCSPAYSYGLRMSLHLQGDGKLAVARIAKPMRIVFTDEDAQTFYDVNSRIGKVTVDGVGHSEMMRDPESLKVIVAAWRDVIGE